MTALVVVLFVAGTIAGLIQFFADYKGLPLYQPSGDDAGFEAETEKGFWGKLYKFVRDHWQFFGYLVIGIAGALLVPVIDQFITLEGVQEYRNCIDNNEGTACTVANWYLLVILGYGILTGYSSVRIIRSIGSFLLGSLAKRQVDQQNQLDQARKQIAELQAKIASLQPQQAFQYPPHTVNFAVQDLQNSGDDEVAFEELRATAGFDNCTENPSPRPWRDWRPAASLKQLLNQINALAPNRNLASDGMKGDGAHETRNSDHNPWVWDAAARKGVVTALDITHDPTGNCDCNVLAKSLQNNQDFRIKYVIWNRMIMNSSPMNGNDPWIWRPYNGSNPHDKHIHISVKCELQICDDVKNEWRIKI